MSLSTASGGAGRTQDRALAAAARTLDELDPSSPMSAGAAAEPIRPSA